MDALSRNLRKHYTDCLKKFTLTLGSVIIGAGLFSCTGKPPEKGETDPSPNILFITADDLGWRDLGCYGNEDLETPHIDSLAESGIRFTNAFVTAPSCSPSRASLLTGQYPHTNGVTGLTHRYPKRSLKPSAPTLSGELREAGYATGVDGKWHVAPFTPARLFGYQKRMTGFGIRKGSWKIPDAEDAVRFIRKNRDRPFYLELNFVQNHRIDHGKFYFSRDFPVDPGVISVPAHYALPDWPEIRQDIARFYSQTMEMDAIVGEILEELEELGLRESTMIVFVSDNGQPYPGAKITLYDRGIGTPLIISQPGTIPAGREVDELVSSIDIMPTILESCGRTVPGEVQGISLLPLIRNGEGGREAVFSEMDNHVHYIPTRAVRTGEWKYIRNYSDIAVGLDELDLTDWAYRLAERPDQPWTRPRAEEELYFLPDDPNEKRNLAEGAEYGEVLARMQSLLEEHLAETEDPFLDKNFTSDYNAEDYVKPEPS